MNLQLKDLIRGDDYNINLVFDKDGTILDITNHTFWFTLKKHISDL